MKSNSSVIAVGESNTKNKDPKKKTPKKIFGTQEWSILNANFINGCKHDCKYCYSKEMAIRFKRKTKDDWQNEEVRNGNLKKKFKKANGTIMFPSSHDIHPDHLNESLAFLENILVAGNKVLIVSKPHFKCIKSICDKFTKFKNNILFRFSIGSTDSNTMRFWEPNAPKFSERFASLVYAYYEGYQTSISCEPMLDNKVEDVIKIVSPFVTDSIWIGKANFLLKRLKINGHEDTKTINKARELIEWQSDENILKLYDKIKDNQKIKWKESIKKIVGIEVSSRKGLDI